MKVQESTSARSSISDRSEGAVGATASGIQPSMISARSWACMRSSRSCPPAAMRVAHTSSTARRTSSSSSTEKPIAAAHVAGREARDPHVGGIGGDPQIDEGGVRVDAPPFVFVTYRLPGAIGASHRLSSLPQYDYPEAPVLTHANSEVWR